MDEENPALSSGAADRIFRRWRQRSSEPMAASDRRGHILFANSAYQKLHESAGAAAGLFPSARAADRKRLEKAVEETFATGERQALHGRIEARDGQMVDVEWSAELIPEEPGHPALVWVSARDLSGERQLAQRLAEADGHYAALAENLPQNVFRKDLVGHYTFANRKFCQTVNRALKDVLSKTDYDLFPAALAQKFQEEDRWVLKSGQRFETIEEMQLSAGAPGSEHMVKFPIHDAQGRLVGIQGFFWDISEQIRSEGALQSTVSHLQKSREELNAAQLKLIKAAQRRSVGVLAPGLAHEVKNPLQAIMAGLDVLSNNLRKEAPGAAATVDEMRHAVKRAYHMVRSLLDFCTDELEVKDEDLNAVLAQALLLFYYELSKAKIRLLGELCPDLPPVRMDKNKVAQVFMNLILNAVQAMPSGGTLRVRTGTGSAKQLGGLPTDAPFDPNDLVVWVEFIDTGQGVPPQLLSRVFDPLFTTKPPGTGTGLGLTVSKKIMELHQGAITLANAENAGAKAGVFFRAGGDASS